MQVIKPRIHHTADQSFIAARKWVMDVWKTSKCRFCGNQFSTTGSHVTPVSFQIYQHKEVMRKMLLFVYCTRLILVGINLILCVVSSYMTDRRHFWFTNAYLTNIIEIHFELGQIMAHHLFGIKPLSTSMLVCCQLDPLDCVSQRVEWNRFGFIQTLSEFILPNLIWSYLTGSTPEFILNNCHCKITLISTWTEHYTVLSHHSDVYFMSMSYLSKF